MRVLAQVDFGETTAALAAFLVVAGPLSVGVTKIVDFIRNLFDSNRSAPSWLWNAVAFVLGIAVCLGWGVNLVGAVIASVVLVAVFRPRIVRRRSSLRRGSKFDQRWECTGTSLPTQSGLASNRSFLVHVVAARSKVSGDS